MMDGRGRHNAQERVAPVPQYFHDTNVHKYLVSVYDPAVILEKASQNFNCRYDSVK